MNDAEVEVAGNAGTVTPATPAPTISYDRQRSIPIEIPNCIGLVGVGGVGSWIGYLLALTGVPKLLLFDSDIVSETNLNRTPYGPTMLGKNKAEALAEAIKAVRPDCEVKCYPHFTTKFADALDIGYSISEGSTMDFIVVSTDTLASRLEVHKWCIYGASTYIEAAAEGEFGSVSNCPPEWATEEETKLGYASVPVWVGPAVSAALLTCSYLLHKRTPHDTMRLGWNGQTHKIELVDAEAIATSKLKVGTHE